jgi:hypothetical protein
VVEAVEAVERAIGAIGAIGRWFGPAEYALLTELPPADCVARLQARVPPRTPTALLPGGGGVPLPGGGHAFLDVGSNWFRLSEAWRAGRVHVGPGVVDAEYRVRWGLELEAVLTAGPADTWVAVAVHRAGEETVGIVPGIAAATAVVFGLLALSGHGVPLPVVALFFLVLAIAYARSRLPPSSAACAPLLDLVRETLDARQVPVAPAGAVGGAGAGDGPPGGRLRWPD